MDGVVVRIGVTTEEGVQRYVVYPSNLDTLAHSPGVELVDRHLGLRDDVGHVLPERGGA